MSTENASSDDLQRGDYLKDVGPESSGQPLLRLIRCPICHQDLRDAPFREVKEHIGEHTPEEAGLTARPTEGVDMDISPYALAEPILLDALNVDVEPVVYQPLVAVREELVEVIADHEPVWRGKIAEHLDVAHETVKTYTRELESIGWITSERGRNRRKLYSLADGEEEAT